MTTIDIRALRVALIGYGEVGTIVARALVERGVRAVAAYDILVDDPVRSLPMRERAQADGVAFVRRDADALAGASLVLCAVTARSTLDAARSAAATIDRDAFFVDLNSASPRTKQQCSEAIDRAGARYVEAAVMASVPPYGIRVPMLLGGPHAHAAAPVLEPLGFHASVASDAVGVVSAIKMCRSVIIKGIEALFIESLLCARRHGVEEPVIASLAETFPGIDWEKNATYYWSRVVKHGRRRSEEMHEAAAMVDDVLPSRSMAATTAERQALIAELAARGAFDGIAGDAGWRDLADRALARLESTGEAARRR